MRSDSLQGSLHTFCPPPPPSPSPASSNHATRLARLPPAAGTKKSPHSWPWLLPNMPCKTELTSLTATAAPSPHADPGYAFQMWFFFFFLRCPELADLVACLEEMLSVCSALFEAVAFSFLSLTVKIQLQPSTVKRRMNAPCLFFKPINIADGQWRGKESRLYSLITKTNEMTEKQQTAQKISL